MGRLQNGDVSRLTMKLDDTVETLMHELGLHADEGLAQRGSEKHLALSSTLEGLKEDCEKGCKLQVVTCGLPCPKKVRTAGHVPGASGEAAVRHSSTFASLVVGSGELPRTASQEDHKNEFQRTLHFSQRHMTFASS